MDDMIVAGAVSIAMLYTAAALTVIAVIIGLLELFSAVAAGEPGRAAAVLAIFLLFLAAYAGAGLWLQKNGRI